MKLSERVRHLFLLMDNPLHDADPAQRQQREFDMLNAQRRGTDAIAAHIEKLRQEAYDRQDAIIAEIEALEAQVTALEDMPEADHQE